MRAKKERAGRAAGCKAKDRGWNPGDRAAQEYRRRGAKKDSSGAGRKAKGSRNSETPKNNRCRRIPGSTGILPKQLPTKPEE